MRAWAFMLLVGCQTHAPVATRVQVNAPTASAAASSAPVVLRQPSRTLAVIARFAPDVTVSVFPLGTGVAVSQSSGSAWSVTALDRDDRATPMIHHPGSHVEVSYAGGPSAKNAWVTAMDESGFPAIKFDTWHVDDANARKHEGRYLGVGELRPNQWVALPSHVLPAYLYDEVPSKLESLGGAIDLPKIPNGIRLVDVAFLGGGRVCGVGLTKKPSGGFDAAAWISESDGSSYSVSLGFDDAAQAARSVRGRDGECIILRPRDKSTDVGRLRGSSIAWSKLGKHVAQVSAAPSGTLWIWDDERREVHRTTNADDATLTTFTMPRDVAECPHMDEVTRIAAVSDDDAYLSVRGACTGETFALVRTSARVAIRNWPAP